MKKDENFPEAVCPDPCTPGFRAEGGEGAFGGFALEFHNVQHKMRKRGSWLVTFHVAVTNIYKSGVRKGRIVVAHSSYSPWPWVLEAT